MPNLYVTVTEIKGNAPDVIQPGTTKYDNALLRLSNKVCRWIDSYCNRSFYPVSETRYFSGNGKEKITIDDFISISALEYSEDDGVNYTALTESGNWYKARDDNFNHPGSYDTLIIDPRAGAVLSSWPTDFRGLKITAVWSYAEDRALSWENSQDTVEDNPLTDSATTLTVNDVDGGNLWGITPRIFSGQILRVEDEYIEVSATATEAETATIIRARNGTTAAEHAQNIQLDMWNATESAKQAALIMTTRSLERGLQGYGDARANVEVGQMFFFKSIDPEALAYLDVLRKGTTK